MSCRPHDDTESVKPGSIRYLRDGEDLAPDVPPQQRQWPDDGPVEPRRGPMWMSAVLLLVAVLFAVAALVVVHVCGGFGDAWSAGGSR